MTISYVQDSTNSDSLYDSAEHHGKTRLRQAIEQFLTEACSTATRERICPRCGLPMQQVDATFALCGTGKQWNIPLPACPCSGPTSCPAEKDC